MFGVLYLAMIDIIEDYYLHFEWIKKFAIRKSRFKNWHQT